MARFLGLVPDPTAGGTPLEQMQVAWPTPVKFAAPTLWTPAMTAQVEDNLNPTNRNTEVRGRRANVVPVSFGADPVLTFESHCYPKLLRTIMRNALGGAIVTTGTGLEARTSSVTTLQSGLPPMTMGWLLREEQLDRLSGLTVADFELHLPAEGEGTIKVNMEALYHQPEPATGYKEPDGSAGTAAGTPDYTGYEYSFMLRDAKTYFGPGAGVELPAFAGITLNFNNGLIKTFRSRYRPGHNIQKVEIEGALHKLWFPYTHKLGAQNVTGKIELSNVSAAYDLKRLFTHAEKLVLELVAGPLATTPAAEEMLKITLYKQALTGGGAEPLIREGDQVSTYDFSAYLDNSLSKDVEATFIGAEALT